MHHPLALLPERGEVAAVLARRDRVDRGAAGTSDAKRFVRVRRRREHERADSSRRARRDLDRDHAAGVVADDVRALDADRIEQLQRRLGPRLDAGSGGGVGFAEPRGVDGDRSTPHAEQRQHLGVLAPAARRLVQQHDRQRAGTGGGAALCVVHLAVRRIGVRSTHQWHAHDSAGAAIAVARVTAITAAAPSSAPVRRLASGGGGPQLPIGAALLLLGVGLLATRGVRRDRPHRAGEGIDKLPHQ